jgi:hypothetical protein
MGLDIVVGMYANSPEGGDALPLGDQFVAINEALRSRNLPEHHEPTYLPDIYSERIGSYSTLHTLRRLAAHLWAGQPLPPPANSDTDAANDPHVRAVIDSMFPQPKASLLTRIFTKSRPKPSFAGPPFPHLIVHSDCDGMYIPVNFAEVLFVPPNSVPVGSSHQLLKECLVLSAALGLDTEADPHVVFGEKLEAVVPTGNCYAVECRVCLQLIQASRASIATGAALVLC